MSPDRERAGNHRVTPDELIEELREIVERLAADGADRGDLKILARTMRELRHAFHVFGRLKGARKVTVFGSARCESGTPLYGQAVAFGKEMAKRGWLVVTGGGPGIMEAANLGAGPKRSMGINILLPFEQMDNQALSGSSNILHMKYFFTRKLLFVKEADGVALFPGGYGTLDEAFEVLTLLQTGKSRLFPLVLVDEPGGDFWRVWREFVEGHLLRRGLVSPEDLSLFRITDDVTTAVGEIERFYRVYHSMRTVGKDLVIRLRSPLPKGALDRLRADFSDILASGTFRLDGCLPDEADESDLAGLPRLVFSFNRRNFGRLRGLVDAINAS
ncbi:MAG: TIGR00730 family Rossman fold protein [Deltaproteobacteria bacterium]|nr:TIGR00730 family Rossman fold protein [Deltaproteobacteria bacterium]